jgi:hypothetical protein
MDGGECAACHPGYFIPWERGPRYPLSRRPVEPQSKSGHFGEQTIPYLFWASNPR